MGWVGLGSEGVEHEKRVGEKFGWSGKGKEWIGLDCEGKGLEKGVSREEDGLSWLERVVDGKGRGWVGMRRGGVGWKVIVGEETIGLGREGCGWGMEVGAGLEMGGIGLDWDQG